MGILDLILISTPPARLLYLPEPERPLLSSVASRSSHKRDHRPWHSQLNPEAIDFGNSLYQLHCPVMILSRKRVTHRFVLRPIFGQPLACPAVEFNDKITQLRAQSLLEQIRKKDDGSDTSSVHRRAESQTDWPFPGTSTSAGCFPAVSCLQVSKLIQKFKNYSIHHL